MGKNHRHTKKLKSEKSKTHITTKTKFLPKGQNVTNTTFKIRSIVIQEQLKERDSTATLINKKNANINELIPKLKHFNDTVKTETCQDLKDLLASNPTSTQVYLSSIIPHASALVQDRERKVRRSSIKLLNTIFEKFAETTLRSFFNYILTNMKCAMTHINKHIQEDALLLLDAILEHKSALLSEHFADFFPNFLLLISKANQTNQKSLSLNLDGKVTSVKWRVKVLARLYGVLHGLVDTKKVSQQTQSVLYARSNVFFVPLYKSIYRKVTLEGKTSELDGHILTLTQLLSDIFMEILPEKSKNRTDGTVLANEEAVAIFSCVVHILRLLEEYVSKGDIFTNSKFLDSFMENFPYTHTRKSMEIAKDFPKNFQLNNDQHCVEQNLILVHLYVVLRLKHVKSAHNSKLYTYVKKCLKMNSLSPTACIYLTKILKELQADSFLMRKLQIREKELMEDIFQFYSASKLSQNCKNIILEILISSAENNESFLRKLPEFLCSKQVSKQIIEAVFDLCRRNNETVIEGVRRNLGDILANLAQLEVNEGSLEDCKKLAAMFYYLGEFNEAELRELEQFVVDNPKLIYSNLLSTVLLLKANK